MFLGLSPFGNALLEPRGQAAHVEGLGVGPEGLQRCQKGQGQPLSPRGNRGQGLAVGLQTEQGPRSPGQGRRLGPVGWVRPHSRSKSLTPAFKSSPPQPCGVRTRLASCFSTPAPSPPPLQAEVGTHAARPSGTTKAFLEGRALDCCCHSNSGSWVLRSEVTSHLFPTQGSADPGSQVQGPSD